MGHVLQHPLATMKCDKPVTVAEAIDAIEAEARARARRQLGILELSNLVDVYGFENVERWLRNIGAAIHGPSPSTTHDPRR